MNPKPLQVDPLVRVVVRRTSVAKLLAQLYRQAPPALQLDMLTQLLRPVGPLALVAIAAGAFGRLLPPTRWQGVQLSADDAQHFNAQQVYELVRYVEQKSPELLLQLPQLVADPRLWLGSATGALLLLLLRPRLPAGVAGHPPAAGPGLK
jgi:hypothetical protein